MPRRAGWIGAFAGAALALGLGSPLATSSAKQPSFASAKTYASGLYSTSVAVGDLNGDKRNDLVAAAIRSNGIAVLLNKGNGSFRLYRRQPACCEPQSVAVGDVNADGKPDVMVTEGGGLRVLLNQGDGTFVKPSREYETGRLARQVAIGDLNGDRKPDLATPNDDDGSVSVLIGNGDGTFQAHRDFRVGAFPISIAVGDLNGDRRLDLATANAEGNTVSVLLNKGDGTFLPRRDLRSPRFPTVVALGNLNGDRRPDLAIAGQFAGVVSVLLNKGGGSFGAKRDYKVGTGPHALAIGDLNGDGRTDLAVGPSGSRQGGFIAYNLTVLTNLGGGRFGAKRDFRLRSSSSATQAVIGLLNGDRRLDVVTANGPANIVSVFLNTTR